MPAGGGVPLFGCFRAQTKSPFLGPAVEDRKVGCLLGRVGIEGVGGQPAQGPQLRPGRTSTPACEPVTTLVPSGAKAAAVMGGAAEAGWLWTNGRPSRIANCKLQI